MNLRTPGPDGNADRELRQQLAALAAPLPTAAIHWRLDATPKESNGTWWSRAVAYIGAPTVTERLNAVDPAWQLDLESVASEGKTASMLARLTVCGITRAGAGTGRDPKAAATDAFKRAGRCFGIGQELAEFPYAGGVRVRVSDGGKFPRLLDDPQAIVAKRAKGRPPTASSKPVPARAPAPQPAQRSAPPEERITADEVRQLRDLAGDAGVAPSRYRAICLAIAGTEDDRRLSVADAVRIKQALREEHDHRTQPATSAAPD